MRKVIYFLAFYTLLIACSSNKESGDNQVKASDTTSTEIIEKDVADIAYTQCSLAYLSDSVLYFHNFEEEKSVEFVEESEPILNFVFDDEDKTLYYSVERDDTLWLKLADIDNLKITPEWVISWQLIKEKTFSNKGMSPLYYNEGKVIIQHGFHSASHHYDKMSMYSISDNTISHSELDYKFIASSFGTFTTEKNDDYFETIDEGAYYI